MKTTLKLVDYDDPADRSIIFDSLIEFNTRLAGSPSISPLNVLVEQEPGKTMGGLWAHTGYGWLSIELLFVPETLRNRGIGKALLLAAETEALKRNCHSARVDTHEFQQAKKFYENCEYSVFGEIEDYPNGHRRYFLQKKLCNP